MSDVKFLPDGTAVLVVADAGSKPTSNDGGRTVVQVGHTRVARLETEEVDSDSLSNVPPEPVAEAAADPAPVDQPSEAMNADQLQAKIDALSAEKAALENPEQ
jgi:hypothetical protein